MGEICSRQLLLHRITWSDTQARTHEILAMIVPPLLLFSLIDGIMVGSVAALFVLKAKLWMLQYVRQRGTVLGKKCVF